MAESRHFYDALVLQFLFVIRDLILSLCFNRRHWQSMLYTLNTFSIGCNYFLNNVLNILIALDFSACVLLQTLSLAKE